MNHTLTVLHVENTTACNLHCRHCTVSAPGYEISVMPWTVYEKLVPAMEGYHPLVFLNGHGEPLMCRDFKRQFIAAAGAGCLIRFQTNGQKLTSSVIGELMGQKLPNGNRAWERLDVSVDAATKGLYEDIRRGASFERLLENMAAFKTIRHGERRPVLNVEFVAMKRNIHELPAVVKLAAEWEADSLLVADLVPTEAFKDDEVPVGDMQKYGREAMELAASSGIRLDFPPRHAATLGIKTGWAPAGGVDATSRICNTPRVIAFVGADGKVRPCCRLRSVVLGDLATQSFDEVWDGEPWRKLLADMDAGNPPKQCLTCNWK